MNREREIHIKREKGYTVKRLTRTLREVKEDYLNQSSLKLKQRNCRGEEEKGPLQGAVVKGDKETDIQRGDKKQPSLHLSHAVVGVYGSVSQSGRQADSLARSLALGLSHALTLMTLLCVCLQMANLVTSLCCVVLAAVVVAYAQRRSQLGEYAFCLLPRSLTFRCRCVCSLVHNFAVAFIVVRQLCSPGVAHCS